MKIGSLFSGIGGLELGLERADLGEVAWQVEIDPFCRAVLAKHWPNVKRYEDVCTVGSHDLEPVDVLCGGFPCQDVSSAGKRRGLDGARSGLWREYRRVVEELRPRFVVVENVASGKKLWLPTVREGLEALGYGVRAFALSAADVGAPHLRRRIFVVADAHGESELARALDAEVGGASSASADADGAGIRVQSGRRVGEDGTDPGEPRHDGAEAPADVACVARDAARQNGKDADPWGGTEPAMVRVVHGIPRGLDGARRKALGNAVVPQCAEAIGRLIKELA